MRLPRNAAWFFVGLGFGSAISIVFAHRLPVLPVVDVVSLASLTVFTMLAASLQQRWRICAVPR